MSVVIFGAGPLAKMLYYYLTEDSNIQVDAFTLNSKYITGEEKLMRPLIPFERLRESLPNVSILPGIGYNHMNNIRKAVIKNIRAENYPILSYIHPTATIAKNCIYGDGFIVLEQVVVQPFVTIGEGCIVFNSSTISHDAIVGSYNWFAPHVCISGDVKIGNNCFLGSNSTIKNGISIADYSLVGANSFVRKDTVEKQVIKASKCEYITDIEYNQL